MQENDQQPKQETQIAPSPQLVAPQPRTNVANVIPFSTSGGLAPSTFQEAWAFAKALSESTIVPDLFRGQQGNCFVALEYAANLKVSPVFLMNNLMFINGRSSLWGDIMLAIVMRHPDYVSHKEYIKGEGDNRMGVFEIERRNQEVHVVTFSVQDAKLAGLWGDPKRQPWVKYPNRMLCMRARGFALRDKFPDALYGLITREEAEDLPRERVSASRQLVDVDENDNWIALKDEVAILLRDHIKTDESGNRWNTARIRAKVESFKTEAELEDYRDSLAQRIKQSASTAQQTTQPETKQAEPPKETVPKEDVQSKPKAEEPYPADKAETTAKEADCPDCKPGITGTGVKCPKHLRESKKNSSLYLKVLGEISEITGKPPEGVTSLAEFDASAPAKQKDIIELATQYRDRLKAPRAEETSKAINQPHGSDLFGNRG